MAGSGHLINQEADMQPAVAGGRPIRCTKNRIIFGAPVIGDDEVAAVSECLRSRWIGLGPKVEQFEGAFAEYKGAPFAAAVSSGSAALHLTLLAMDIGPGDEVIAPTMTFCATTHAIVHVGAHPVLVDCHPETFNMDVDALEGCISPRTKAIMVVHIGGRCCSMDEIMEVARRHNLMVIEDCAHAVESIYRDTPAGLIGDAGCFSFYATKSITTGDGGMVITNNKDLHRRVKDLSQHGMSDDAWTRSKSVANSYQVMSAGYKYNMTDIEASLGLVQLESLEKRWHHRRHVWNTYSEILSQLPIIKPVAPAPDTRHAFHLYTLLLDTDRLDATRDAIVAALNAENIGVGIHYIPVHMHPYYIERFGFRNTDFPVASSVGERSFSLPLNADLSESDVYDIYRALNRILTYYQKISKDS